MCRVDEAAFVTVRQLFETMGKNIAPCRRQWRRADDEGGLPDHGRAQRSFAAGALPTRMTMGPVRSKDWWFIFEIVSPLMSSALLTACLSDSVNPGAGATCRPVALAS